MRRVDARPRANWREKVEALGLPVQSNGRACWNESAFFELSGKDVDALRTAANELDGMTLEAVQYVIDNRLYARMAIPEAAVPLIEASWTAKTPSVYGRFDLAYDGVNPPKLLEYSADSPTALPEAAVIQGDWLAEVFPGAAQCNSIQERLVALWENQASKLAWGRLDFYSLDDPIDRATLDYLAGTARLGGLAASTYSMGEIGWNGAGFVGADGEPLSAAFKLYPWEWMIREEFGRYLNSASTIWIEPPWKMLLSTRAILPVLWNLFPRHPYLLEASLDGPGLMLSWVRKPLTGRAGVNVTVHRPGNDAVTPGSAGAEYFVYQALPDMPVFGEAYPVIGCWVIGHDAGLAAAGIGARESGLPIATSLSRFVPHVVR